MNSETRIIKASIYAGMTDVSIGLLMYITGFGDWYYTKFHVFGVLGIGMVAYGLWHGYLYKRR